MHDHYKYLSNNLIYDVKFNEIYKKWYYYYLYHKIYKLINISDKNNLLLKSAKNNCVFTIKILIDVYKNKNDMDVNYKNKYRDTALILASEHGHYEIVKLLLDNGADVNYENICGDTALIKASSYGHCEIVEILLKNGENIDHENTRGYTALMFAIFDEYYEIAEILLKNGANINHKNKYGATALIKALFYNQYKIVKLLKNAIKQE